MEARGEVKTSIHPTWENLQLRILEANQPGGVPWAGAGGRSPG